MLFGKHAKITSHLALCTPIATLAGREGLGGRAEPACLPQKGSFCSLLSRWSCIPPATATLALPWPLHQLMHLTTVGG